MPGKPCQAIKEKAKTEYVLLFLRSPQIMATIFCLLYWKQIMVVVAARNKNTTIWRTILKKIKTITAVKLSLIYLS